MITLTERNLQISVNDPNVINAYKFDDPTRHRLTHCMKAVDFLVELPDQYLFIEIKDPETPGAVQHPTDYFKRFQSGQIDEDLKYKCDSFLYEWEQGRADRDIHYLILIALSTLKTPHLQQRRKELERKLPLSVPSAQQWIHPIVASCNVFNIESWNRSLPNYPVARLP